MLQNEHRNNAGITRRSFLTAIGIAGVLPYFKAQAAWASSSLGAEVDLGGYELLLDSDHLKVYQSGSTYLFIDDNMACIKLFVGDDGTAELTGADGVIHELYTDEYGRTYCDGVVLAELLYLRSPEEPVPNGCVLMSTSKMTVEQAAAPTQLVGKILGFFGSIPVKIATAIANFAFNYMVDSHADMWLVMKHWYCDSPKMITRKEWFLYSDKACTKLVKSWVSEAPVGVEV